MKLLNDYESVGKFSPTAWSAISSSDTVSCVML